MPVTRTYQCPDCEGTFSFLHLKSDEPPPDYCAKCGAWMGEEPEPMPSAPFISKPQNKAGDVVYRQMEKDSAARAEMTGDPTLKLTDLKDNLRAGDVAAKTSVNNPVSNYMEAARAEGADYGWGAGNVAGYIGAAKQGPVRDTGARALAAIQGGKDAPLPSRSAAPLRGSFGGG